MGAGRIDEGAARLALDPRRPPEADAGKPASPRRATLHSVAGPEGSPLGRWLDNAQSFGELRPLVGPFQRPIVRVSGSQALLDDAARSLPDGAATPEAVAVRLRRAGVELEWGAADVLSDPASYLRLAHARGASSVELVRADPSLLTELQLGAFFHAYWIRRVARLAACRALGLRQVVRLRARLLGIASDVAFWLGVRSAATEKEWRRLARSSYVVFYYHGIGDGWSPEQEHVHIDVDRFDRQMWWLRRLGFRALSPSALLAFHSDPAATLPRRSFVLGADDAFRDAVEALRRHADLHPQVFVNTSAVGGTASWAFGEPLASWQELTEFEAAGGVVASHTQGHEQLPELTQTVLDEELFGALRELRARIPTAPPLLAYPYGLHDEHVRSVAALAGYRAAFTTEPGRNGAGTDVYCLRRIGMLNWDSTAAFLWKALTGELLPWPWERRRRRSRSGRATSTP
jgi:peptidoglycan/xylan/chitin deacetylase (PgdA/CDA1 family)